MAEIVAILSANLARVRPAGMSDDAAHEWLTVCATDVRHLPVHTLRIAAAEAARTVTHHGQIIPAILGSNAVKGHELHERAVRRLAADGHDMPRLTGYGEPKRIGQVKAIGQVRG